MRLKNSYPIILLSVFLIVYIVPLGARGLIVPDETRYGEIPREMIIGGDWVVPHFNGLRYFEKPAMGYWVHAVSMLLFGENTFAVRLPSALSVGLSALMIYVLVFHALRRSDEDPVSGAGPAVLVFLTCFEVAAIGTFAVLDSLFAFFLTATITSFYFASEAHPGSGAERRFLVTAGVSCGLAFLTKGFLAFAVPIMVLTPYLAWQRRYRDVWRMSLLPILVAVTVSLPWSILIHAREPDFWRFFFWNEHIRRFLADDAQHKASFWYFFLSAPGMFMPWTFVAPAALGRLRNHLEGDSAHGRLLRLSLCWLVSLFLFFSVSNGKLLTYILPCFPPFAVLLSFGLSRTLEEGRRKAFRRGVIGTGVFFGLLLAALVYVQLFGVGGFHPYSRPWQWLMAANSLLFLILFSFWALRCQKPRNRVLLFGFAPLLLFFVAHFVMPDLTVQAKAPGVLLKKHIHDIGPQTMVISDDSTIGATCWYLRRNDIFLLGNSGEFTYGLRYDDAADRPLDMKSAARLIARNRGNVVLVARAKHIRQWRDGLPEPAAQDDSGPEGYVFWQY